MSGQRGTPTSWSSEPASWVRPVLPRPPEPACEWWWWTAPAVAGGTTGAGEGNSASAADKSPGPELDLTLLRWRWRELATTLDSETFELEFQGRSSWWPPPRTVKAQSSSHNTTALRTVLNRQDLPPSSNYKPG